MRGSLSDRRDTYARGSGPDSRGEGGGGEGWLETGGVGIWKMEVIIGQINEARAADMMEGEDQTRHDAWGAMEREGARQTSIQPFQAQGRRAGRA